MEIKITPIFNKEAEMRWGKACVLVVLLWGVLLTKMVDSRRSSDGLVSKMVSKLEGEQCPKDQSYDFPWHFKEQKGLYNSYIHMNYHGNPFVQEIRKILKFYDMNGFVTEFVAQFLLEAHSIDATSVPVDQAALIRAIDAIGTFHDHNVPAGKPTMTFWPQMHNETTDYWQQYPINLLRPVAEEGDIRAVAVKFLDAIGMKKLADLVMEVLPDYTFMVDAFVIPADADDTSVNFELGNTLFEQRSEFPAAYAAWMKWNGNFSESSKDIVKYAYRPYSEDPNEAAIDPRSFFILNKYLVDRAGVTDIALATTWMTNIDNDRTTFEKNVGMPFHINNVDGNVCANFLIGMVKKMVMDIPYPDPSIFSDDFVHVIESTADYVQWVLEKDAINSLRADFVLPYYPSTHFFYFSVSRTLSTLHAANLSACDASSACMFLKNLYPLLLETMEDFATEQLLGMARKEGSDVYWDDFLGDGDEDFFGKLEIHGEDRIFSTALSINALLNIWTSQSGSSFSYLPDTPESVKDIVSSAADYLRKVLENESLEPENAFFAGSGKSKDGIPFFWPENKAQYLNGTEIDPLAPGAGAVITNAVSVGMSGSVDPGVYASLLEKAWFDVIPTVPFGGYNAKDAVFPYWSSPAMTHVVCLLALVKLDHLN